jgi:hypothetical protein
MVAAAAPATQVMQGIAVPASSVDAQSFFRATRRLTFAQRSFTYGGMGTTDIISILQTGIIAAISVKFSGTLTTLKGSGAIASTARWPYDLIKNLRVSANGQSNLINVGGNDLKVRSIMARGDLTDRSVSQGIGGASPGTARTNGTLSLASESWGVGQNVSAIADGSYAVEFEVMVPLAFDMVNLMGAIFAQTSSTDLQLVLDWASLTDLFTISGTATVALTGSVVAEGVVFSIPQGPNGDVIVPDLSVFHSLIRNRYPSPILGENEVKLAGQGIGRQLLRMWFRTFNNSVPLPMTAANYGKVGWRYGGNDTPEVWTDGQHLRYFNEMLFNSDIGGLQGYGCIDFASEFAFRDTIDEGAASELRIVAELASGLTLASPFIEYVQETAFAGSAGA